MRQSKQKMDGNEKMVGQSEELDHPRSSTVAMRSFNYWSSIVAMRED
jgi:hypothetical protein